MRILPALAAAGWLAVSLAPAHAGEWCGFLDKTGSRVRCGFSSLDECKKVMDTTGAKDPVCMPDPSFAQNSNAVRVAASRF